jgi:hypothetical protein
MARKDFGSKDGLRLGAMAPPLLRESLKARAFESKLKLRREQSSTQIACR